MASINTQFENDFILNVPPRERVARGTSAQRSVSVSSVHEGTSKSVERRFGTPSPQAVLGVVGASVAIAGAVDTVHATYDAEQHRINADELSAAGYYDESIDERDAAVDDSFRTAGGFLVTALGGGMVFLAGRAPTRSRR